MRKLICYIAGLLLCVTAQAQPNVVAWGSGVVTNVPSDLTDAVQVSTGLQSAAALCAGGDVELWGDNSYGQVTGMQSFGGHGAVQVTSGDNFNAALMDDGTVRVGGIYMPYPEFGGGEPVSNAVQIAAAGVGMLLALHADGTLQYGGTNIALPNPPISNAIFIAACPGRFGAILSDGTVRLWNRGGTARNKVAHNATNAVSMALSATNCVVLRSDGVTVEFSGLNTNEVAEISTDYVSMSSSAANAYALKNDSSIVVLQGTSPGTVPSLMGVSAGSSAGMGIVAP